MKIIHYEFNNVLVTFFTLIIKNAIDHALFFAFMMAILTISLSVFFPTLVNSDI